MKEDSRTDWKRWLIEITVPIIITLVANVIIVGKYIQRIEETEKKVEKLEQVDEKARTDIVRAQIDQATINAQLASIQKSIEEVKTTQVRLMEFLSRRQK